MLIDGNTELVGIIGYPIGYTLSPAMHNAAFRARGMNWLYVPLRVPPGKLGQALAGLRALGFRGANITIPHKLEAAGLLDALRGESGLLRAVNTVIVEDGGMIGCNTDVEGFFRFLEEEGIDARGSSCLLIGAGGASRAVALALAGSGAAVLHVMNRTPRKAEELRELLKRASPMSEISIRTFDREGARVLGECDIIVNCTPLAEDDAAELPLDYGLFASGQMAVDLKYSRRRSAFLEEARSRGARTANGEGMLVHQAAASFRLWTGENPPLEEMRAALRNAAARE